ncbi:hypothetical protein OROMI_006106 [Orobanche minor]
MREFNTHTTLGTVAAILGDELLATIGEGHDRGGSGVRRGARLTLDVYYTFDGSGAACVGRLVEEMRARFLGIMTAGNHRSAATSISSGATAARDWRRNSDGNERLAAVVVLVR